MAKVGEHESHDERKQEVKAGRQQGPTLITVCLVVVWGGAGGVRVMAAGYKGALEDFEWWGMNVGRTSV